MANNIDLRTEMVALLDEVFKEASKTSILDTDGELVKAGANAKEIQVAKMDMDGLADYDRKTGYTEGSVTLEYETKKFNYDRGREFSVDVMDNQESGDLAFGKLASEFIRTKVVPEVDAMRICAYAKVAEANGNKGDAIDLATQSASVVVEELRKAINHMDEAEVPAEGRILFITPTLLNKLDDMPLTESRAILDDFAQVVKVPQVRMNMDVQLGSNGFTVNPDKKINFLVVRKEAVIQIPKHVAPKHIPAIINPKADADIYTYRTYQMAEVYDNKVDAIYVSAMA